MECCLYHPGEGYYRRGSSKIFGRAGDYMTSPHAHEFFAHCLADYFHTWFLRLNRPSPFQVFELGAADGRLAEQILSYLATAFPVLSEVIDYVEIDLDRGDLSEEVRGIVFSNEFFDALPVHRVRFSHGELRELYVAQEDQELQETWGPLSDPRIEAYVEKAFHELREDWIYEVNLRMLDVLDELDMRIRQGVLLTIDYGYTDREYESMPRPAGTLACYRRHQVSYDPYHDPGQQDMTCHVPWEMLIRAGRSMGWRDQELVTQRDFLMRTGLVERLLREESGGLFCAERLDERLKIKELLYPGGLSDAMKVLVQEVRC